MNSHTADPLFRVLLAEDDPHLSKDLVKILEKKLYGVKVDLGISVKDALSLLNHHFKYDLAIIDLRLPRSPGGHPSIHQDFTKGLIDHNIASICITGYRHSKDVEHYLRTRDLAAPPVTVITKTLDSQFVLDLVEATKQWLQKCAGEKIRKELRQVFIGAGDDSTCPWDSAGFLSLQHNIVTYWKWLDIQIKETLHRHFCIHESDEVVTRISLFEIGAACESEAV